jgi:sugar phosphate isomerase/epimerase
VAVPPGVPRGTEPLGTRDPVARPRASRRGAASGWPGTAPSSADAHEPRARARFVHAPPTSVQAPARIVEQTVAEGERRRLKIGFEAGIFARTGLGALPELIKLVDEISSPWFGVYEHCYWPRGEQQPHEEIALVGQRMVALHSSYPSVQVDYKAMRAALKEVGYDWYWCFEVPWEQARGAIGDYRHIMRGG